MCIVACRYIPGIGWVGAKNRDRNYRPTIHIKQSFRNGIERMYIWDEKTKYTEGLNEYGVCIISAATAVKDDEKEGGKGTEKKTAKSFQSPDGRRIRTALFEKTPKAALKALIKLQIPGNTFIFNEEECYLLEGTFINEGRDYNFKWVAIKKDESPVRTNHGIMLPDAGYQMDSEEEHHRDARVSSEARLKQVRKDIEKVQQPRDMFDALSSTKNDDAQLNPVRLDPRRSKKIMKTTGQILIVPKERMLRYRPIWSFCEFDFAKIEDPESKTFFEIESTKGKLSFRDFDHMKKKGD